MKNKLLMMMAALAIIVGGVYFGMQPSDEKKKSAGKEAEIKKVEDKKSVTGTSQDPKKKEDEEGPSPAMSQTASFSGKNPEIQNKKNIYNNDQYWGKIKKDAQIIRLYNKTLGLFKKSAEGEDLAVWIASGLIFDQSAQWGPFRKGT